MPHIKANDINIYFEQMGKGDDLLIIGGFSSTHKMWQNFQKMLSKNFRVTIFDIRGSGATSKTEPPYSMELLANDTVALLNNLSIGNAYILGHSMGSAILQTICLKHPKYVKKAILSGAFCKLPKTSQMIFNTVFSLLEKNVDKKMIIEMVLPWLYSSNFLINPENVENMILSMSDNDIDRQGYLGQAKALEDFDSTEWAHQINKEPLILVGKEDIDTPVYLAERLHDKIAGSKLKIIEDTAHMLFIEKAGEMEKIVCDFFK
jgi:pimeloyl-ACP methyl ester carboxylesterase